MYCKSTTHPWLHHELNGDYSGLVEMGEDVDVGEEDGGVELEQTFAQDHTEGWTKHQKTDIQDVSQKHHSFGFSWKKSQVKLFLCIGWHNFMVAV